MRPPFETRGGALAFSLLVACCLALPLVIPAKLLPSKEESYAAMPDINPMDYLCQQIYHEKEPLDVAFLGGSRIWMDVSSPLVNEYFDAHLHRACQVQTLAWQNSGFDEAYFVLRDLLAHRKVRLLVLYREWDQNPAWRKEPHPYIYRAFRYAEDRDELAGLPLKTRMSFYGTSIFAAPRTLLSLFQPALGMNRDSPHAWEVEQKFSTADPRETHGCLAAYRNKTADAFTPWRPPSAPSPDKVALYSATPAKFELGDELDAYQRFFAAKIRALAEAHDVHIVLLNVPWFPERAGALIKEPANWPALLGPRCDVIGISPDDLWGGLSDAEVSRLFSDVAHLNANGQAMFAEAIAPTLLRLYEKHE